ncbi:MAG: SpoIIE family protein phosphatase [Nitrospirae bacterium]|nr:SpoIIE family protein phosphatase [Nitrospirota bacterium]
MNRFIKTVLKNRGITFKLIFLLLTGSILIFALVFKYNYELTRKIILKNAEDNARHIAEIAVNKIEGVLLMVQRVNQNSVKYMETIDETKEDVNHRLRQEVENNREIYGATLAYAPHTIDKELKYYAPYYFRRDGAIIHKLLGGADNYFNKDWYQIPMELGRPIWSEPYFDPDAQIIESTYSVPFREDAQGERFIGVSATDVDLNWLHETVASVKMFKTGYAFLISKNGTIVTHPDKNLIMNESIFSIAETREDKNLREIGKAMIRGETGFKQIEGYGLHPVPKHGKVRKSWLLYMPLKSEGWSLGLIVPEEELLSEITALHKKEIAIAFAGMFFLSILIASVSASLIRPLKRLAVATKDIARGNLDIETPYVMTNDEIGQLTASFTYMKTALKDYIRELTLTTRAKQLIESELKIAHDIQMSFLRKIFPPFPDIPEFDIFAAIMPAKEVGGDFYDFFFIDDTHLCFIIADVSGKGVPASLFMAMTMTMLRAQSTTGLSANEILFNVNAKMAKDNNVNMFVTIFYGILDIKTGVVEFANGGHNPPLLYKKATAGLIPLETGGIVVGIMEEDITFDKGVVTMHGGDFIVMYTDGVTEAINEKDEEFGEERLNHIIAENHGLAIDALIGLINDEVNQFSGQQPQFDDITLMVLKYEGCDNTGSKEEP